MATIEERADRFASQIDFNIHKNEGTTEVEQSIRAQGVRRGYIQGATEQDNIARQEERERCICIAQECIKELIDTLVNIKQVKGTMVIEFDVDAINAEIRKAMAKQNEID